MDPFIASGFVCEHGHTNLEPQRYLPLLRTFCTRYRPSYALRTWSFGWGTHFVFPYCNFLEFQFDEDYSEAELVRWIYGGADQSDFDMEALLSWEHDGQLATLPISWVHGDPAPDLVVATAPGGTAGRDEWLTSMEADWHWTGQYPEPDPEMFPPDEVHCKMQATSAGGLVTLHYEYGTESLKNNTAQWQFGQSKFDEVQLVSWEQKNQIVLHEGSGNGRVEAWFLDQPTLNEWHGEQMHFTPNVARPVNNPSITHWFGSLAPKPSEDAVAQTLLKDPPVTNERQPGWGKTSTAQGTVTATYDDPQLAEERR